MKIVAKLKSDRKLLSTIIGIIIALFLVPYLTIPGLILWWFYKKSKFSRRFKIVTTSVLSGILIFFFSFLFIAYANDAEPQLSITQPSSNTLSVKDPHIVIAGTYSPADRKVWINGNEIQAANGKFETTFNLIEGDNKIEISTGNWKRAKTTITVSRESKAVTELKEARATVAQKITEAQKMLNDKSSETSSSQPTKTPVKPTNTLAPAQTQQTAPASGATVSQQNAVRKAQSYLSFSGFSHDGLVAQLEYEKFSHEDAVYGADNSGANWNEQAAKKAKSYMDIQGYSRDGLIEQLKYEKFTQEQAEYGANAVGL